MAKYAIEYTATTKYLVEFSADSLEDAKLQATNVLHPLQLDEANQIWLAEYDEAWDADEIAEV